MAIYFLEKNKKKHSFGGGGGGGTNRSLILNMQFDVYDMLECPIKWMVGYRHLEFSNESVG